MKRPVVTSVLAIVTMLFSAATEAAPRKPAGKGRSSGGVDPSAQKVDLFKAAEGKQVNVQVLVQAPGFATLTLTNVSENPLTVEVPLCMAAEPALKGFGRVPTPQTLAVAVNPRWAAGVEKKSKKTGVKTNRKTKDNETKDEKKPDEKKDDEKDANKDETKSDTGVALVPLPAGVTQQLPLFSLGLETPATRPVPTTGFAYQLAEFDKRIQAPEMKKLMEHLVQGTVPPDSAQLLAWHYHGRLSWEEMGNTGLVSLPQIQVAQHFAEVVEGRAAPDAATPQTAGKKKKR